VPALATTLCGRGEWAARAVWRWDSCAKRPCRILGRPEAFFA